MILGTRNYDKVLKTEKNEKEVFCKSPINLLKLQAILFYNTTQHHIEFNNINGLSAAI